MPRKFTAGLGLRRVDQEETLARADLELDGIAIAEEVGPIDRRAPNPRSGPGRSNGGKRRLQVETVTCEDDSGG